MKLKSLKMDISNHFVFLLAALFIVLPIAAQTPPAKLEVGKSLERQIKGGETQVFEYNLKAGNYARAEVEQKDIDVVVSLFAPDGELVIEMDGKNSYLWREAVSAIAERNGAYKVEIKAYGAADQVGSFTIKLVELHLAETKDSQRIKAEQHFYNGRKNYLQDQPNNDKAIAEYESAIKIWHELGEDEWEAIAHFNLAWAYSDFSKKDTALSKMEQALLLFQKTTDRFGEVKALNGLGLCYSDLGQVEKSAQLYEMALIIRRELKDKRGESTTLNNLGLLYQTANDYKKSLPYFEQALAIRREIKDKVGEGYSLNGLGFSYRNLYQFDQAVNYYEQSVTLWQNLGNQQNEIDALNALGHISADARQHERARNYYERALSAAKNAKYRSGEAESLLGIGAVFSNLSDYEKSKDFYEQSLAIYQKLEDKYYVAFLLRNLGYIYQSLSQYEKAISYNERSLTIFREIKNTNEIGSVLISLGNVYDNLAQYQKAKNLFEQALVIKRESKDRKGEGATLGDLAIIYKHLGLYVKAKDYYEQSLIIARETKDYYGEGIALNFLGIIHERLGLYEKAKDYYEQSLIIAREIKDHNGESNALTNLGVIYDNWAQFDKANDYYEKALIIKREIKDRKGEGVIYRNLLVLSEKLKNPQLAILYGKQAVNIYQEIRGNIKNLDKESQQSFLGTNTYVYRRLSDILISEGRFAEAQSVLDLIKEQEYKDISRGGEISDTVPYSKSEAETIAKIDKLAALGSEQTELRKQQKEQADQFPAEKLKRLEQIKLDMTAANAAFDEALAALSKTDPSVKDQAADIKSEKNLQSTLLELGRDSKTGVVALYTVIGTEEEKDAGGRLVKDQTRSKFGWVILVTKDTRKAYPIDVTDLEQTVFQFKAALSSDRYDPKPLAQKLYTALFRQTSDKQKVTLEQDLNDILGKYPDKTLMWSLDGVLRYIPMAALNDGRSYLVEKYRNVLFTRESLISLKDRPNPNPQALGLGVSAGNKELKMSELPGVDKELADIIKQPNEKTGILNGSRKINNLFKKQELLNLEDEDNKFQVVHIASHYSFNPADQNASYLLIGDGKMTFGEMKTENNLFGTVDLLTLSACDTGVSGNGKEAEGFAYLAQSLGAKSVIASLWEVSDAGTPELMIRFYKLRAEHPEMSKGEAFRQAQLAMLGGKTAAEKPAGEKNNRAEIVGGKPGELNLPLFVKDAQKPFAHPHYWSSFVLIGNWR